LSLGKAITILGESITQCILQPKTGTNSTVVVRPHSGRLTFGRMTIVGTAGSTLQAGIDVYGADVLLTNNVIRGHRHGVRLNEEAVSVGVPEVTNNTIASSGVQGIWVRRSAAHLTSNLLVETHDCAAFDAAGYAPPLGAVVANHLFWQTGKLLCPGNTPPAAGNVIGEDPLFFNDTQFFFAPDSPASDAGPDGAGFADVDGTRNDIGAYGGPRGELHLNRAAVLGSRPPSEVVLPFTMASLLLAQLCRRRRRGRP